MTKALQLGRGIVLHKSDICELNEKISEINRCKKLNLFGLFNVTIDIEPTNKISPLVVKYNKKLTDANGEIRRTIFTK